MIRAQLLFLCFGLRGSIFILRRYRLEGIIKTAGFEIQMAGRKKGVHIEKMKTMMNYYTYVIIITLLALFVLSILVYENDRIPGGKKRLFILTNSFIAIAAAAECAGVHIGGNTAIPRQVLIVVKTIDYTFTPMTGAALIALMEKSDRKKWIFWGIFAGNAALQVLAAFHGWMIVVDNRNHYTHSVLYPVYIVFYSAIIIILAVKMLSYGRKFRKQNRKSLYATILLVFIGVAMQELIGQDCRVAYLATTFGSAFMFIHYSEFSQIRLDDKISQQQLRISNDVLTGVFSRFAYMEAIREYDSHMPDDLAVFLVDVNGLKAVNDSTGHEAGDELICAAAECIDRTLGRHGRTFRIGGDEFVVLGQMSEAQVQSALTALKQKTVHWHGKKISGLSLSVGYALSKDHKGLLTEQLVKKADQGMYEQKKEYYRVCGRDRRSM